MLPNPFDDRPDRAGARAAALGLLLIAANLAAWAWAWLAFAPRPALLGLAGLAYGFGLRHAFDADHIAAIDNAVRRLMQRGKAPLAAGLYFALGHSTVVILAAATLGQLGWLARFGGSIGTALSALLLIALGLANLAALRGLWRGADEAPPAGLLARLLRPLLALVGHGWQLYPVGFLFGLGFDTATEIGLLGLAASQAAAGLPLGGILVFPVLFAAGMALVDTADSVLMVRAYGWALTDPARKRRYNLTITALSAAVALAIAGIEALGLLGQPGGSLAEALDAHMASLGGAVAGILLACWILAALLTRLRGSRLAPERP